MTSKTHFVSGLKTLPLKSKVSDVKKIDLLAYHDFHRPQISFSFFLYCNIPREGYMQVYNLRKFPGNLPIHCLHFNGHGVMLLAHKDISHTPINR